MLILFFSTSDDQYQRDETLETGEKYYAYELFGVLDPEKNRSNDLIGRISNIGNR